MKINAEGYIYETKALNVTSNQSAQVKQNKGTYVSDSTSISPADLEVTPGQIVGMGRESYNLTSVIGSYYNGSKTTEEVVAIFKSIFNNILDNQAEANSTPRTDREKAQILVNLFHRLASESILHASGALTARAAEVARRNGETCFDRFVFFDSEFGFKAFDLYNAMLDAADEIAREFGNRNIRQAIASDRHNGMNTDFFGRASFRNGCGTGHMLNQNLIPPRGFSFFFKAGSEFEKTFTARRQIMIVGGDFSNGRKFIRLQKDFEHSSAMLHDNAVSLMMRQRGMNFSFFTMRRVNAFDFFSTAHQGGIPDSLGFLKNFEFRR